MGLPRGLAGCYVNATIRLWVQDSHGQKRVNAELRGVQFVKDGDSFGAPPIDPEKEFKALDGDDDENGSSRRSSRSESSRSSRSSGKKTDLSDF